MKKLINVFTAAAVISSLFSGCTLKRFSPSGEMPEDRMYNKVIMEVDSGYYYNTEPGILSLRYTERSNGADIFLCAKPECTHDGEDTCTATYQFLNTSNFIMYDGAIYFTANTPTKETSGSSLYRASLDGTALDKIGDVRRVKIPGDTYKDWGPEPEFVIHKGYAFIPYCVGEHYDYAGFIESGLIKMDIKSGKTETIFSSDKYSESRRASVYGGCGDYVYYNASGVSAGSGQSGNFRYSMKTGESEYIDRKLFKGFSEEDVKNFGLSGITEKTIYLSKSGVNKPEIHVIGYDARTLEPNGIEFDLYDENVSYIQLLYYNDKIFSISNKTIDVYSDKGELIGRHEVQPYLADGAKAYQTFDCRQFDISENRFYVGYYKKMLDKMDGKSYVADSDFTWYYCPIENIVAGTGEWTEAYTVKGSLSYWKELPVPKFIKENVINEFS